MSGQFTPDWAMIVYHVTLRTRDIEDMTCFSVTNTARVGSKLWRTSYIARVGSKLWRTSYIARVASVSVYGRLLLASK